MWKWNAFKKCESKMLERKITIKYSFAKNKYVLKNTSCSQRIKNDQLW